MAWRSRETFRPGSSLTAWTFTILRNAYLTLSVRERLYSDSGEWFRSYLRTEREHKWRLRDRELLRGLDQRPECQRHALLLVAGADLSYEEAGRVCGCSIGTVKSRVSRARGRMVDLLDEGSRRTSPKSHPRPVSAHEMGAV